MESSEQENSVFAGRLEEMQEVLVAERCRPHSTHGQSSRVDRARVGWQFQRQSGSPDCSRRKNGQEICRVLFARWPNWTFTCTCSPNTRGHMLAGSGRKSENIICSCVLREVSAKHVYKLAWIEARTSPGHFVRLRLGGRRRLTQMRGCSAC